MVANESIWLKSSARPSYANVYGEKEKTNTVNQNKFNFKLCKTKHGRDDMKCKEINKVEENTCNKLMNHLNI